MSKIAQQICILLIAIIAFYACSGDSATVKKNSPQKLTILYFNDFHGHLKPFKRSWGDKKLSGGFARLAYLAEKFREENAISGIDTILLSGGDNVQGTPMSMAFKGMVEIEAFNKLGLDASAVGNHDFDYGPEALAEMMKAASFPFLSANVFELNGSKSIFEPYKILKLENGLKIGLIGMTTPETSITTHPVNVADFRFARPTLAMQHFIPRLDQKTDLLIVLSHLGANEDKEFARSFPDVDVIIGGHTHTSLQEPMTMGEVLICQSGDRGLYLGKLDLEIENDRAKMISNRLIPISDDLPENEQMAALIDSYDQKLSVEISRIVGHTDIILDGERHNVRSKETNLGSLIADLIKIQSSADLALINGGGIRASIMPGDITLGDAMRSFPMNNSIVTVNISGEQIYRCLARSVKHLLESRPGKYSGGFLQVSGVRFIIADGVPKDIRIAGSPLKLFKTYKLATIDFLAAGGDGYKEIKEGRNYYDTGVTLRDLFVGYLSNHKSIAPRTDGRIMRP